LEVSETVLWFVAVPALAALAIGGLAYAFGGSRRSRRYRPGRPYDFAPVWFLSAPERLAAPAGDRERALAGRAQPPALSSREVEASRRAVPQGSTGGASDRW
jgi:hypothetical protein